MKLSPLLAITLLFAPFTYAEDNTATSFQPGWYGELNLGQTNTSWNQGDQDYDFLSVGGTLGYRFSENFATEFFSSFSTNGKKDPILSARLGQKAEAEFGAVGFYLTAQNSGDYYVKGRVGLTQSRFTYTSAGYTDETESNFGFSYGIGAGIKKENLTFEISYMVFPEVDDPLFIDTSYDSKLLMFSVGKNF